MSKRVTIDDDDLAEVWAAGMTMNAIAARMNCHPSSIRNRVRHLDLTPRGVDWARKDRPFGPRQLVQSPPKLPKIVDDVQPPPTDDADKNPAILAMLKRLGSGARAVNCVASHFRLPYAAVNALAARAAG